MPARIGTLSSYLTVTVFFNKISVTHIIGIDTLETVTILIYFQGWTIAFSVLEDSLELRTVCESDNTLPIRQSIRENALHSIAILLGQFTLATLFV